MTFINNVSHESGNKTTASILSIYFHFTQKSKQAFYSGLALNLYLYHSCDLVMSKSRDVIIFSQMLITISCFELILTPTYLFIQQIKQLRIVYETDASET